MFHLVAFLCTLGLAALAVDVPWTAPGVRPTGDWRAEFDPGSIELVNERYAWRSTHRGDAVDFVFQGSEAGVIVKPGATCDVAGLILRDSARPAGMISVLLDGAPLGHIPGESRASRHVLARGLAVGRHVLHLVNEGNGGRDAPVVVRGFFADRPQPPPRDWTRESDELAAEVKKLAPFVYFTGSPLKSSAVPNVGWDQSPVDGRWGGSIRVFDPSTGAKRTIHSMTNGVICDLALSYDARRVLFTRRLRDDRAAQIFEIGVDGTGLRHLTADAPDAHNTSPVYLADGRIAFVSSRGGGSHTVCQSGPSLRLHVMDGDGAHARRLSSNTLCDLYPGALGDGRILYTRWEYVDWNLTFRQSLWTQYPDGRQMSLWFGNLSVDPASFVQAVEFPGGYGVACTLAPHHDSPYGAIGSIDVSRGPENDDGAAVRNWTPEFPCIFDKSHFWAWCWPWPVAADRVLASRGDAVAKRFRIQLLASDGRRATVLDEPGESCFRAIPLVPRAAPKLLADFTPESVRTFTLEAAPPGQTAREEVPLGRLVVSDVCKGLDGKVARERVAHVRVMEQLPKTVNRSWNGVFDQGPLMGASTYYAKRVWSYAPVAADGSANFEVPALKEIYLQLVDAEGRELRRMTSALNLMPGETQSCTGCHENRRTAAVPLATAAARRASDPIRPPEWGNAGVIDYVRVVQPVWDRHCVRCHSGATPPKGLSLAAGRTRFFNVSYDALVLRSKSDRESRERFTGKSEKKPLVQGLHLLRGITEPYEPLESGSWASRLPEYLEKGHCGVDVPAADKRRVYEWIDAQLPYYATSDHAHVNGKSGRDRWGKPGTAEMQPWFTRDFLPLYGRNCAACHGKINVKRNLTTAVEPSWWWFDLTHPEFSAALLAHLPEAAGGRGVGKFAFKGREDPLWLALDSIAREAARAAAEVPEADEPGFRPLSRGRCEYRIR